jgi:hypothetical protein
VPFDGAVPPPAKPKAAPAPKKNPLTQSRAEMLTGLGQLAQLPLLATGQHADAGAVGAHWPGIAREIANLAESQPAVAAVIDPLMKAGPYAALIAAVLPLALQIGVNHGRIAAGPMGTVPASVLESQVKTALAEQELEALRVQQQAETRAAQMREELEFASAGAPGTT